METGLAVIGGNDDYVVALGDAARRRGDEASVA
jgi:hypothetical protein